MGLPELAISLTNGVLSSSNPCVLPLYPGFLAYLGKRSNRLGRQIATVYLGVVVLFGVLVSMLLVAAVTTLLGRSLFEGLVIATPAVDLLLIGFGILLVLNRHPWARIPQMRVRRFQRPLVEGFVYGMLYGPIALPCNAPLVLSVVAYSVAAPDALASLSLFLLFGLGFGLPLLALPLLSRARQAWLIRQFTEHYGHVSRLAGAALLILGVYDLVYISQFLALLV